MKTELGVSVMGSQGPAALLANLVRSASTLLCPDTASDQSVRGTVWHSAEISGA